MIRVTVRTALPTVPVSLATTGIALPGPLVLADAGPVMPAVRTTAAAATTACACFDRLRKIAPAQE
ncbi:hypothetical protein ACVWZD_005012 [Streptomyces sp. TE3672]